MMSVTVPEKKKSQRNPCYRHIATNKTSPDHSHDNVINIVSGNSQYMQYSSTAGFDPGMDSYSTAPEQDDMMMPQQSGTWGMSDHKQPSDMSQRMTNMWMPQQPDAVMSRPLNMNMPQQSSNFRTSQQPDNMNMSQQSSNFMMSQSSSNMNMPQQSSNFMASQPPDMNMSQQISNFVESQRPNSMNMSQQSSNFMMSQFSSNLNMSQQSSNFMASQPPDMNMSQQSSNFMESQQPNNMNMSQQGSNFMASQGNYRPLPSSGTYAKSSENMEYSHARQPLPKNAAGGSSMFQPGGSDAMLDRPGNNSGSAFQSGSAGYSDGDFNAAYQRGNSSVYQQGDVSMYQQGTNNSTHQQGTGSSMRQQGTGSYTLQQGTGSSMRQQPTTTSKSARREGSSSSGYLPEKGNPAGLTDQIDEFYASIETDLAEEEPGVSSAQQPFDVVEANQQSSTVSSSTQPTASHAPTDLQLADLQQSIGQKLLEISSQMGSGTSSLGKGSMSQAASQCLSKSLPVPQSVSQEADSSTPALQLQQVQGRGPKPSSEYVDEDTGYCKLCNLYFTSAPVWLRLN